MSTSSRNDAICLYFWSILIWSGSVPVQEESMWFSQLWKELEFICKFAKFLFENFRRSILRRFNYRVVEFHIEQQIERVVWARIIRKGGKNWYDDTSHHRRVINLMHEREYRHRYADDNERLRACRTCRVCIYYTVYTPHRGIHFMKAIPRAYLSNQDINGRGRRPISLDDYSVYHILFRVQCNWLPSDRKCAAF